MIQCEKCSESGYVPLVLPDNSVSRHAKMVCPECGGYSHERDYADANMLGSQSDDFDFSCSDTWRGYYNREREHPRQAELTPADKLDNRRWQYVQQMRGQLNWLNGKVTLMRAEKKVAEVSAEHKKKPPRQRITYKGIK